MPDPIAAPSATLAGQAAAIPIASIVANGLFGVPYELLAWGLFGGLVAVANVERTLSGWQLAVDTAVKLTIGAGVGGGIASIGADVVMQLAALMSGGHIKLPGSEDARMVRTMAIALGACTAIIPELYRIARSWLKAKGTTA